MNKMHSLILTTYFLYLWRESIYKIWFDNWYIKEPDLKDILYNSFTFCVHESGERESSKSQNCQKRTIQLFSLPSTCIMCPKNLMNLSLFTLFEAIKSSSEPFFFSKFPFFTQPIQFYTLKRDRSKTNAIFPIIWSIQQTFNSILTNFYMKMREKARNLKETIHKTK